MKVVIFSDAYPLRNAETFLHNELLMMAPLAEKIYVVPQSKGMQYFDLPANAVVIPFNPEGGDTRIRTLVQNHGLKLLGIMFSEIFHSPHRWKYIRHFKQHFFLLLGYLRELGTLKGFLDEQHKAGAVFYSYWMNEWATRLSLYRLCYKPTFKYITRIHAYDFDEAQMGGGYHPFRFFDMKNAARIISISQYGYRYVSQQFPRFSSKINVSCLGIRDKGINPLPANNATITIVSCSGMVALKRVHLIPEILKHFNGAVHWVHFGDGPENEKIKAAAALLPPHITCDFKGMVSNDTINAYYASTPVSVFINVSHLEGIPVALMEAASFGIPLVGCNICGVPEIVNAQTGVLLDENFDAATAAASIKQIITLPAAELETFRRGVKQFWHDNFNAETNYRNFFNQYLNN